MRAVIQRCKRAKLEIDDKEYSKIDQGLVILLGIGNEDDIEDIKWLSGKISKMRIFSDNKMTALPPEPRPDKKEGATGQRPANEAPLR